MLQLLSLFIGGVLGYIFGLSFLLPVGCALWVRQSEE